MQKNDHEDMRPKKKQKKFRFSGILSLIIIRSAIAIKIMICSDA